MTLDPTSNNFKENANQALADKDLQSALNNLKGGLISNRKKAIEKLPEFEELKDKAKKIKDEVFLNLDFYLEKFEMKAKEQGGVVHWAEDSTEAKNIILNLFF